MYSNSFGQVKFPKREMAELTVQERMIPKLSATSKTSSHQTAIHVQSWAWFIWAHNLSTVRSGWHLSGRPSRNVVLQAGLRGIFWKMPMAKQLTHCCHKHCNLHDCAYVMTKTQAQSKEIFTFPKCLHCLNVLVL